jgi:hypothetical protein
MRALPVLRHRVLLTTLVSALGLTACEKNPAPPRPSVSDAGSAREVTGPAAFDVVELGRIAVLIWADPAGRIVAERFDREGGRTQSLRTADAVTELAALRVGERIAVSWVELGKRARVRAALFDFASGDPAVTELGFTDARRGVRGHVALSARDGSAFTVMHRAEQADCVDKPGRCTRFEFHEVRGGAASSRPMPLLVPEACPGGVAGLGAHEAGIRHYAVCSMENGRRVNTVFTIQEQPMYAVAERALEGCSSEGFLALPDGKEYLLGRCGDGLRRAFRPARVERKGASFDVSEPTLGCLSSGIEILFSLDGARHYRLETPEERVERLLPERIAPAGARAVWTGEALIVAQPSGTELEVSSWSCAGIELVKHAAR